LSNAIISPSTVTTPDDRSPTKALLAIHVAKVQIIIVISFSKTEKQQKESNILPLLRKNRLKTLVLSEKNSIFAAD
jgi:hypothetical protein